AGGDRGARATLWLRHRDRWSNLFAGELGRLNGAVEVELCRGARTGQGLDFVLARGQGAVENDWPDLRLIGRRRRGKLDSRGRVEAAEPGAVFERLGSTTGNRMRIATAAESHMYLAFKVGNALARSSAIGLGTVDPEDGFLALGSRRTLLDSHGAAEDPDLVAALLPMRGAIGLNSDRVGDVADRQLDGSRGRRIGKE